MTILNLFETCCRLYANETAVIARSGSLTYKEFGQTVKQFASHLVKYSIDEGDCIGLYLDPSLELMVGVWGVLMAGGAYLPLSPDYPTERISYMVNDSKTKIVITQDKYKETVSGFITKDVCVLTVEDLCRGEACSNDSAVPMRHTMSSLAYVIYTSGSTGNPKGVMIEHQAILNQMQWIKREFSLGLGEVILQKTPISFDAAQWEMLLVCCGCTVVVSEQGMYKDPYRLIQYIKKYDITILQCVPTLLQALLDMDEFLVCQSLGRIFSGGEVLKKKLAAQCLEKMPNCKLVNLYGPTECTINSSFYEVNASSLAMLGDNVPIGAAIHGLTYVVLDEELKVCSPEQQGELCIGGIGVARGYLHRPKLTKQKFISYQASKHESVTVYRTGDLVKLDNGGVAHFMGRKDNQVKLHGYRIELDEISSKIARHQWVRHAATVINEGGSAGRSSLVSFIELDAKQAPLMDQGVDSDHHRSKNNKAQVTLQLSNAGVRDDLVSCESRVFSLPRRAATQKQIYTAFARKTYRFYKGDKVELHELLRMLDCRQSVTKPINVCQLEYAHFAEMLRYFGQFKSKDRLLPKYAYASPGALYPTQMYFEISGINELPNGCYYYNPVKHELVYIRGVCAGESSSIKVHFVGKKSAIEPIYKNNIQEVLEMEVGHMVGLFEMILPEYGLSIQPDEFNPGLKNWFDVKAEDYYLGSFQLVGGALLALANPVELYVQANNMGVSGLNAGLYRYSSGSMQKISDRRVEKNAVIAINQAVFERSSLGISIVLHQNTGWLDYINLGRKLQQLQMNDFSFGFMSSGYSSKTGNNLPSAVEIQNILGVEVAASYFCLGGKLSAEQVYSQDMSEDVVHMQGPAEIIKEDLANFMPDYMLPRQVLVIDKMPLTPNGKINAKQLAKQYVKLSANKAIFPPDTDRQKVLHKIWSSVLRQSNVSIQDNVFDLGANSLLVVVLVNKINQQMKLNLPLQALFKNPTIEKLALYIENQHQEVATSLVLLQEQGKGKPIYCWPGLGGCVMNLRSLSERAGSIQPFYGIQVCGINENETPHANLQAMALADIAMIRVAQPKGPYELWGYSFGARAAFEVAYQLQLQGEEVSSLVLVAPGSPGIPGLGLTECGRDVSFDNQFFLSVLVSVFLPSFTPRLLESCFHAVSDEESFVEFIAPHVRSFSEVLIKRIMRIVCVCYGFHYSQDELDKRFLDIPIIVVRAKGDHSSFIDYTRMIEAGRCIAIDSQFGHYEILKRDGVGDTIELVNAAKRELNMQKLEVA
jgi:amino acid adenylation domain-containing protein